MRMPFDRIFAEIDGRIVPEAHIAIGGIVFGAGIPLSPTLMMSGIEIAKITNRDLEVELEDGIIVILGFYRNETLLETID